MRHKFTFIRGHKEFEPIYEGAAYNKPLIEEYKNNEINRTNSLNKTVYDCFDNASSYYSSPIEYIKQEDLINIPIDKSDT